MPFNPEVLGFKESFPVTGKPTIVDIYPQNHRCGIYLLEFSNGEYYCGQAKDVTRRYIQHRKNHPDISAIRFFEIEPENLNDVEEDCIHKLEEAGLLLRNISFASVVHGETDFNKIMTLEDQKHWLSDAHFVDFNGERFEDENLRRRYQSRFQKLMSQPKIELAIEFMNRYAHECLPAVRRSEHLFWCSSCLPSYKFREEVVYSRININQQEVLTVALNKRKLIFSFHLAKSFIEDSGFANNIFRQLRIRTLFIDNHSYSPGGHDQTSVSVIGIDDAQRILEDPILRRSIRAFNLRLMRKGPCLNKNNHCLLLADRLVE